jgi:hypothetical protein
MPSSVKTGLHENAFCIHGKLSEGVEERKRFSRTQTLGFLSRNTDFVSTDSAETCSADVDIYIVILASN